MRHIVKFILAVSMLIAVNVGFCDSSGDAVCSINGVTYHYEIVGPTGPTNCYTATLSGFVWPALVDTMCLRISCSGGGSADFPVGRFQTTVVQTICCASIGSDPVITCCLDDPCPVEMTSFTATGGDNRVAIRWRTESETNNSHFKLYRSNDVFLRGEQIADLPGHGTTGSAHTYEFIDTRVQNGTEYWYRIADVSCDGVESEHRTIVHAIPSVTANGVIPLKYSLENNYPNPFNPTTEITYGLRSGGNVLLAVFDVEGREVARLVDTYQDANTYHVVFNASTLPSGVYFYMLKTAGFTTTKRMVFMK